MISLTKFRGKSVLVFIFGFIDLSRLSGYQLRDVPHPTTGSNAAGLHDARHGREQLCKTSKTIYEQAYL